MSDLNVQLKQLKFSDEFINALESYDSEYVIVEKVDAVISTVDQVTLDTTELILSDRIEAQTKNYIISQV